jgi:hypothetical protein
VTRKSVKTRALTCWKNLMATLIAVVREIFDESAYARFLTRTSSSSSAQAYSTFLHEQEASKARRPRCC